MELEVVLGMLEVEVKELVDVLIVARRFELFEDDEEDEVVELEEDEDVRALELELEELEMTGTTVLEMEVPLVLV